MESFSIELEERVNAELRPGERLVWAGKPRPGRFMRMAIPFVLFGIPWTAFALFWEAMAIGILDSPKAPAAGGVKIVSIIFPLFGLPFVLIGFAMLSSPYWMYRRARRTCYAVTDQRAVIFDAGFLYGAEVRSYGPEGLQILARRDFADGNGDLILEEYPVMHSRGFFSHQPPRMTRSERGFLGIENVREVEELLRQTLLRP